jgi:hypothetical protein
MDSGLPRGACHRAGRRPDPLAARGPGTTGPRSPCAALIQTHDVGPAMFVVQDDYRLSMSRYVSYLITGECVDARALCRPILQLAIRPSAMTLSYYTIRLLTWNSCVRVPTSTSSISSEQVANTFDRTTLPRRLSPDGCAGPISRALNTPSNNGDRDVRNEQAQTVFRSKEQRHWRWKGVSARRAGPENLHRTIGGVSA